MAPDTTANPPARATGDLRQRVEAIRWYHRIDLGDGIVTPGVDPSPQKLQRLQLPADLSGRTVLDVGAWDGFFSFEAERRGAARVLATDSYAWSGVDWGTKQGFELARTHLGSTVEDMHVDVFDLSPQDVGVFDVTLFLGVLYHLRHPMLALEKVAAVTGGLLILETAVDMVHVRRPCLAFYPGSELKGDPTNWFGPNPAAVEAMLRSVGFPNVKTVYRDSVTRRAGRAIKWRLRDRDQSLAAGLRQGRAVFHAWR
jgi:tRNA (mo5U34)-methyltransferase